MFRRSSWKLSRGGGDDLLEYWFRDKPILQEKTKKRLFSTKSEIEIISTNYSFTQAPCMQHWRKNWENQRQNRLTSSTFAQAIGFWPNRRVQLWLEKIGALEPFSGNAATCWTKIKELEALNRYHELTGHDFLLPEFVTTFEEEEDWLGASPDGDIHVLKEDGSCCSSGVLEVKCPFYDGDKTQAYPWKKVPWHYVPQAQGLMEIMDRDWLDLYCWTVNGSRLFRIERDSVFWGDMRVTLVDFWEKHVLPGRDKFNGSVEVITDPLVELIDLVPDSRHERCNQILRGTERIVDRSKRLFYEINGHILD